MMRRRGKTGRLCGRFEYPARTPRQDAEPRTRKREVRALDRAMAELGLRSGTIVTRGEEETIPVDAGSIDVVPAWRFLLDVG